VTRPAGAEWPDVVHRATVCAPLAQWANGTISHQDFCSWATNNYFPGSQQFAPGEPPHVESAIHTVLSRFEFARPPYLLERDVARCAIALVNADLDDFEARKAAFDRAVKGPVDAP
jgi:hypothetical protein